MTPIGKPFKKGHKPWNKNTKGKMKAWNKGKNLSEEHKKNLSENHFKKHSLEARKKMSNSHKGEKNPQWKGGISKEGRRFRQNLDYVLWRQAVFERDEYTCQDCGIRGGKLEAHHFKSFTKYPEFRYVIQNGITPCFKCHKRRHKGEHNGV